MIAGAIFDADGTLLDSMPIWDNAAALYLEGLGYIPEPGLGRILYPMSMAEGADYLIARYGLSQSREEIVCGVSAAIEDFYFHRVQPKAGLEKFLRQLQERGIPMVVATSSDRRLVEAALKRLGLLCGLRAFSPAPRRGRVNPGPTCTTWRTAAWADPNRSPSGSLRMRFLPPPPPGARGTG